MFDMKYDMSGAACVLGAIKAIAKLGEEINVIGLIPATENMPGGSSIKPGDIVTSMSGSTIEILNTDAEGRIILADALSYSKLFNPEYVIDVATLTGATVIALGTKRAALFTNSSELQEALTKAANNSNDFCWSMPLDDEYFENLSTNFADMANVGPPEGSFGASAYFLSRFTQDVKWAHLDITGVAWQRGKDKRSPAACAATPPERASSRCSSLSITAKPRRCFTRGFTASASSVVAVVCVASVSSLRSTAASDGAHAC